MIDPMSEMERCICVPNAAFTGTACTLCGENEVGGATGCACAPGFGRGSDGVCAMCGENEVGGASGCTCATGFARDADGACAPVLAGQGAPCSTSMPCTDATFNYCATSANAQGYCTTAGCTGNADCTTGYACEPGATPYCKRSPVGAGMSCTSSADCAGTEATFCDTIVEHACLVEGCSVSPNNCFGGRLCCDLTKFGIPMPICIAAGACP
jgi:hypothetical protein